MTRAAKILQHDVFSMHGGTPLLVTTYNLLFIYSFLYNCIIDNHITKWPISIPLFPHLFEIKKKTAA